jgi:membrane protein YdbS with pleckstrin-like domain
MQPTLDLEATHRLGSRAFLLFWTRRTRWSVLFLFVLAGIWLSKVVLPGRTFQIIAGLALLWFIAASFRAYFEYKSYAYRFEREFFKLIRGYLARQEIGVVYHQIQTVSLRHGFWDRTMGISHLVIIMTGNRDEPSEVILPALDRRKARLVQEELLRQARIRSGFGAQSSSAQNELHEEEVWR